MLDGWSAKLNWTQIETKARGQSTAQGVESQVGNVDTIISPWVNLLFELRKGATNASAHWKLSYNTLDLDFCKNLYLSERFHLTPFCGFRGAWLDQKYRADYKCVFLLTESSPSFTRTVNFVAKNDFNSFGIRTGGEILCTLACNWHLFSRFSANLLYGKFNVHMKNSHDQGIGESPILPPTVDLQAFERMWRVRLAFAEAIGFDWQFTFRNYSRLSVRAAYELSQWLGQNSLFYTFYFQGLDTISSVPIRNQGTLSFHGIRIEVQFDL